MSIYSKSDVEEINSGLEKTAEAVLSQKPNISFKALLAESTKRVPQLDADSKEVVASSRPLTDDLVAALGEIAEKHPDVEGRERFSTIADLFGKARIGGPDLLKGFRLRIWGAGSCGPSLAYLCSAHGAHVVVCEKRGGDGLLSACARTPNVSWKNFEKTMRAVLSKKDFYDLYGRIVDHGGVVDERSGKFRSSIGGFQEALYSLLSEKGVRIDFARNLCEEELRLRGEYDIEVVATGVHAFEHIPRKDLEVYSFPDAHNDIFITTTMFPCDWPPGFYREEWEEGDEVHPYGKVSWRRKNVNVQPVSIFSKEIRRFIFNLERDGFSREDMAKAASLLDEPRVAHVFYFGNQRDSYHCGIGDEGYPCLTKRVHIDSWMLNRSFARNDDGSLLAFLGDATGWHPSPRRHRGLPEF